MIKTLGELLAALGASTPHELGRALYKGVACGPWVSFLRGDKLPVYYEAPAARRMIHRCTGVRVGSIVEGSDVEVSPRELGFPFKMSSFWDAVEKINEEAEFYWKRDNLESFLIIYRRREYWVDIGWYEPVNLPPVLKKHVMNFWEERTSAFEYDVDVPVPGIKATMRKLDKSWLTY